ncbi:MAG: hypothetical protein ACXAEX_17540 [Promethearchaeota archaeon]
MDFEPTERVVISIRFLPIQYFNGVRQTGIIGSSTNLKKRARISTII